MNKNMAALWALGALLLASLQAQDPVESFDDIRYWVGSGQNRAVLVLQWNDGLNPVSIAWGYRWDGTATGMDMLRAIAGSTRVENPAGEPAGSDSGADDRLRLGLVEYSFGFSVLSLEYLPRGGIERTQSDWFNGYWEYLIRGGSFEYYDWAASDTALYSVAGSDIYKSDAWTSSPLGAGERPLIDGAWDAYTFAPASAAQPVQQPVAADLPVPAASCFMNQGKPSVATRGEAGFIYQLQYSETVAGPWTPMGDGEPGSGGEIIFQDESTKLPANRFYRITVRQAP